jgi:phosphoribosylformylglycinamidine (FGAM) synthase-like amidotransferase family enzyme
VGPKAIIIVGYGFNADAELAEALRLAGAVPERVHLSDLLASPERILGGRILAFPGGFSFGDHLGSGQVVALLCRRSLRPAIERFTRDGGLVIGVCNGFQALVKMGMLPNRDGRRDGGGGSWTREVSLIHNASGRFIDDWVPIHFEKESPCLWTRGLPDRSLPVRHGEGRFIPASREVLVGIQEGGLIALRYGPGGNPNGSEADVAGICDPSGRIFGLMPHPEAYLCRENHPDRRRGTRDEPGIDLFENGARAARDST